MTVMTPLFSGDDPADGGDAIRVPSIRGQLRFWFRALAAGRGYDETQVWEQEEEVFGSTRVPSRIALRVDAQPGTPVGRGQEPPWTAAGKPFAGTRYLLGPGLWQDGALSRGFVPKGRTFELAIRFTGCDRIDSRFLYAFWAWLTLGGLGARTRRGFGQLRCHPVDGTALPDAWTFLGLDEATSWPTTLAQWNTLAAAPVLPVAEDYGAHEWGPLVTRGAELPDSPTLTPAWWGGRVLAARSRNGYSTFNEALQDAGRQWREFLLCSKIDQSRSTPEWRDAIIGDGNQFPRAALGLPVVYHRPQPPFQATVQADRGQLRRASPVWIRPVLLDDNRWHIFTHAFRAQLLPNGTTVTVEGDGKGKQLDIPEDAVTTALDAWLQVGTSSNRLRPGRRPQR